MLALSLLTSGDCQRCLLPEYPGMILLKEKLSNNTRNICMHIFYMYHFKLSFHFVKVTVQDVKGMTVILFTIFFVPEALRNSNLPSSFFHTFALKLMCSTFLDKTLLSDTF